MTFAIESISLCIFNTHPLTHHYAVVEGVNQPFSAPGKEYVEGNALGGRGDFVYAAALAVFGIRSRGLLFLSLFSNGTISRRRCRFPRHFQNFTHHLTSIGRGGKVAKKRRRFRVGWTRIEKPILRRRNRNWPKSSYGGRRKGSSSLPPLTSSSLPFYLSDSSNN